MATAITPEAADELLRRYEITPPSSEHGGARPLKGGYEISLGGHRREDGQKMLTLTIGNISESRPCPFMDGESQQVVRRFCEQHSLPRRPALEHMLAHLVARASKLYALDSIDSFVFDAVHIHESGYRIGSVRVLANKSLKLRRPPAMAPDMGTHRYDARNAPIGKKSRRR